MTQKARKKMQSRMKKAFKAKVQAKKRLQRAVTAHTKLVKRFRAA